MDYISRLGVGDSTETVSSESVSTETQGKFREHVGGSSVEGEKGKQVAGGGLEKKVEKDLLKIVSKEEIVLQKQLEKFLSDSLLKNSNIDDKLLTNKLYKDQSKIHNPQATTLNLHTQVLLQPWNYTIVNNEIYFRILSLLKGKGKTSESINDEIINDEIINENKEQNSKHKGNQHKHGKIKHGKIKEKSKDSLENLEGLAFIQWLSVISDEDTNELNDFLNRMRIFQPLEFFQRVQNISTNINLFVDPNGQIKVTNFHKDKKIIEQQLNERGRLRSHIWAMVGFDFHKNGNLA